MPLSPVLNPGFEVDLASWTLVDANPASVTRTRDTTTTNAGSAGSMKMVNTGSGDDHTDQTISGGVDGVRYTVSAWVNCTVFTAGATGNRGLRVEDIGLQIVVDDLLTAATSGWVLKSVVVPLPAGGGGLIIRLYSPNGTVYWDDVSVVYPSGLLTVYKKMK